MRNKIMKTLVILTATSMLATSTMNVSAAGLKSIFSAKFYSDRYQDLNDAFGYNEKALFSHYLSYGLTEKRVSNPILDVQKYREAYADLDAAFGDDWDAYVDHYFDYGIYEGRTEGVKFNPIVYADTYEDVRAAYGDDYRAIVRHYLTYGIMEGRTAGLVQEQAVSSGGNSGSTSTDNTDNIGGDTSSDAEDSVSGDNSTVSGGDASVSGGDVSGDDTTDDSYGKHSFASWVRMDNALEIIYVTNFVDVGTDIEGTLPDLQVLGSNDFLYDVEVAWDYSNFDKDTVGIYTIYGTVEKEEEIPFDIPEKVSGIIAVEAEEEAFYGYYSFKNIGNNLYSMELTPDEVLNPTIRVEAGTDLGRFGLSSLFDEHRSRYQIVAYTGSGLGKTVASGYNNNDYNIDVPGTYTIRISNNDQYGSMDDPLFRFPDRIVTLIVE